MREIYEQYKSLLFTLAYQLTGSAADSEDIVQDVFLKVYDIEPERLTEPKAYLCKMAVNRAKDLLKSARHRREHYVGEWLPEPIATSGDDAFAAVERGELLSYGMLVMLEKLTAAERAVFVLHEALGFDYADIAAMMEKTEANCRKLMSRARGKLGMTAETPVHPTAESEEWVQRFLAALAQGNMDTILSMLAQDVELISDGGGKVSAAVHPIRSREHVTRFFTGLLRLASQFEGGVQVSVRDINGQAAFVVHTVAGIELVGLLHVEGHTIRNVYLIRNPDKLERLS